MSKKMLTINVSASSSVLGILLVILKGTGQITWAWPWVLAPFWLPIAIIASIPVVLAAAALCTVLGIGFLSFCSYVYNSFQRRK